VYTDRFFNQLIQSTSVYETNSGTIPQQEFTYLKVAAGQGVIRGMIITAMVLKNYRRSRPIYRSSSIYSDLLPNRIYIKTHQNKFSQSVTINPNQWQKKGLKKLLSYFYNQTAFIIDRKTRSNAQISN
jgi:hypothetical protein